MTRKSHGQTLYNCACVPIFNFNADLYTAMPVAISCKALPTDLNMVISLLKHVAYKKDVLQIYSIHTIHKAIMNSSCLKHVTLQKRGKELETKQTK